MTETKASENTDSPFILFLMAIKSPATRKTYVSNLRYFFDSINFEKDKEKTIEERCALIIAKVRMDPEWLNNVVRDFVLASRDRIEAKSVSANRVWTVIAAFRLFFAQNDIDTSKWTKYLRGLPRGKTAADDIIPDREDIIKVVKYPDRRLKPLVYAMASGGFRFGVWESLKWAHVKPQYSETDGNGERKLLAAKVVIYAGEPEQYFTFITPEAYSALKEWMDYRQRCGEAISSDSPIMRDLWNQRSGPRNNAERSGQSFRIGARIDNPRPMKREGLCILLYRAWMAEGIRGKLPVGKRRHPFAVSHAFRKYFKTNAEKSGMKSIHVELLMGHSVGVSDSYYRPAENDLLSDYLKAVPALTFETVSAGPRVVDELRKEVEANDDSISSLVQDIRRQKAELERLRDENDNFKAMSGMTLTDKLEDMQLELGRLRRLAQQREGQPAGDSGQGKEG